MSRVDVCVIGGGPAGLSAALELRRLGVRDVLVVDREPHAGGIPRHANHIGFGMRDLHRVYSGPAYARKLVQLCADAGVMIRPDTTVTEWQAPRALTLTGPVGREELTAEAIVLATGCRERPRSARLVPGTRPLGVFTTGALQQLVYLEHRQVGKRAVIVGAEHVSFSAVITLAHGGARAIAMTTELGRHQTYWPLRLATTTARRVPVHPRTVVTEVLGRPRVEGVELTDLDTGDRVLVECDTVVFTGDWIPDYELGHRAGLAMDPAGHGPRVDQSLRTSREGVVVAGNLLHAAETADRAALSGRHAATTVWRWLDDGQWPQCAVPLEVVRPLRWISPSALSFPVSDVPHGKFLLRSGEFRARTRLVIRQDDRLLWHQKPIRTVPNRPVNLETGWVARVDPDGGTVVVAAEPG